MQTPTLMLLAAAALIVPATATAELLPWPEVKRRVESHWKTTAPAERLLSVARKGKPEYSSSQTVTDTAHIGSSWYSAWVSSTRTVHGSFARQVALVTVERTNQSRARFEVAALYRGEGKRWIFDRIAVGPVTELGAPGDPVQPSEAEAIEIFRAAWERKRPDFAVTSMKLLAPPTLSGTPKRRVLRFRIEVAATGTAKASKKYAGRPVTCKPADYSSTLAWDAKVAAWTPNESMIQNINEDRDCTIE